MYDKIRPKLFFSKVSYDVVCRVQSIRICLDIVEETPPLLHFFPLTSSVIVFVKHVARDIGAVADNVCGDVVVEMMGNSASPQCVGTNA